MEYIRTGLPRLAELFGPVDASYLGRITGRLIGAQYYSAIADRLGIVSRDAEAFGTFMARLAIAEGDVAEVASDGSKQARVTRRGWRLARGWGKQPPELFEAWNGLWEGALLAHNRSLQIVVTEREDLGDQQFVWEIRPAP